MARQKKRRGGKIPGGTPIGTDGDALLNFVIGADTERARQQIAALSAQGQRTGRLTGGSRPGSLSWRTGGGTPVLGAPGRVGGMTGVIPVGNLNTGVTPTGRSTVVPTSGGGSPKRERNWWKRNVALGAEGVRIGDVRLSRSGLSVSEKTFVGSTGGLAATAALGQVAGHGFVSALEIREKMASGQADRIGELLYSRTVGTAARLARMGGSIFGMDFFAAGLVSIFEGVDVGAAEKIVNERWQQLIKSNAEIEREARVRNATQWVRTMVGKFAKAAKMEAELLGRESLEPEAMVRHMRGYLEDKFSEERAMTRSATGRPLWKVVNYAATEGIP